MKKKFTLITLLSFFVGFAQIPPGYYSTAVDTGYLLKTELYNIIKGHTDRTYAGLYTTYLTSDKDFYYENNGTLLDMYTENPTGSECEFTYGINQDDGTLGTSECQRYNREHLIPQSVFSSNTPMYSDAHFVVPSDKYVNGQRGDLPFGKVNVANQTYTNGTKRGSNLNSGYSAGYSGTVFEPIDEFKGDIARMLLYFAVRYETQVAAWSFPMFNGTSNQVFTSNAINVLLTWHNNDPVSNREIARNNAIYTRQNNRNPFIDHPEYVNQIWNSTLSTTETQLQSFSIYPNPVTNNLLLVNGKDLQNIKKIEIFNISGAKVQTIKAPFTKGNSIKLNNLSKGVYILKTENNSQKFIVE